MNHINFDEQVKSNASKVARANLNRGWSQAWRESRLNDWVSRQCKTQLLRGFSNLRRGMINVSDSNSHWQLGQVPEFHDDSELNAAIYVHRAEFYRKILLGGTIGSAESFIDGDWDADDLTAVIRIFIQNLPQMAKLENTWGRIRRSLHWIHHQLRRNTKAGSRRNIGEHYDLGNEFYSLFLDRTMNYSSGIFADDSSSMLEASLKKMEWIGHKLQLKPTDHLLEIGSGWGGLAIYLAQNFGCRVTTTTISKQQYKFVQQQIAVHGLQDQITLLHSDYRDLAGKYDKIASIEMIEAVGHQYFDQYFAKCSSLLTDDGLMLIQAITMSQQNYAHHIRSVDFIRRYIFPGGCLPSVVAIGESVGRATDMRAVHQEDITEHYVRTLQCWLQKFHAEMSNVRRLGFDQKFVRLWHFYLCYCEAAFIERRVQSVQMVFAKPQSSVDPANDFVPRNHEIGHSDLGFETTSAPRLYSESQLEAMR